MAENIKRHITHIKSKVVESSNPKLPTASQIEYGEIAVNYAKGYETISIKNESGDVVTFSEDKNIGKKGKLTGYAKASSASAVATGDTINTAIGKLEKALDSKQPSGSYVTTSRKVSTASGLTGGGDLSADRTIGLVATGTSGTYGPTADVTGSNNTTIKVPQITTDAYGRVTSVTERTLTNKNSTYTVNNGKLSLKVNGTEVSSFTANQSAASTFEITSGASVGDGTIKVNGTSMTVYTHPTTVGNKHIPSGGATNQFLGWDSDGTAKWVSNPNTDTATTLNGHYTPASSTTITKNASSTTNATWGSSDFVTGITLYKDAKGHITDMAVSSLQLPTPETYSVVTTSKAGLAPVMTTTANTIATQTSEFVLTTTSGGTPTWRKLPTTAFSGGINYSAGSFLDLNGTTFSAKTGTTSSTLARGDHDHDSVYAKITDTEEMEQTLTAAITDIDSRAADKEAVNSLAERVRILENESSDYTASINDLSGQSETISAAINDLDNKKADSVEVFSSLATKANKSDINDLETDVDDLIKQSETISAALNYLNDEKLDYVDFFDYTSQMKSALESIEDEIEDLSRTVVMSITTTDARGYGESTPTLAQYTGNKSNLNGILSHFKLGWFNSGGTLVQECAPGRISAARDGSEIAINGSNGDLMVYVDTDIYRDRATVSGLTVNGSTATTHNVIGLGLAPHQIGGSVAKKFSPFGFTPHCAKYSNSKGYSYYDGGNVQTSINSLTSSVNALNKGGGYMGLYYEFYEIWLIAMYLELGTLDFTQDTLFGYGCTNYTPTASNWFSDVNAGGGGCMYSGNTYGSFWSNTVSSYNFAEMLEAQRIMDGVVKADLVDSMGGTVMMTYDSNGNVVLAPEADPSSWANSTGMTEDKKYFTVKNVPGCQGLGDGVMTGVVNIYVKGTDRIRKYSHPIYRGVDLLSGFFVQLEGLHYVVKHTGTTASLAQSQELFYCESWLDVPTDTSVYTNANSIVTADTAEGLTDDPVLVATYRNAGAFPTGSDGWGKETDYNISLFAHRTTGGAQHTYECGHIWYRGTSWSSPAGTDSNGWLTKNAKSANASVVGCHASFANAGRTLNADHSVADSHGSFAGGFAHPQIKVK